MTAARKTLIIFIILVAVVWMQAVAPAAAQGGDVDIFILTDEITSNNERFVSLQFTVRDGRGFGITDLGPGSIGLSEAATNITLVEERAQNIDIAMLVDLSAGTNTDLVQETMRSYFLNYYVDGDTVTLYFLAGDERQPIVADVQSHERALQIIDDIPEQEITYSLEDPLTFVRADLRARLDEGNPLPRHVLHIASYMPFPDETEFVQPFRDLTVPYSVVQAHISENTEPLQELADVGGGLYVDNEFGDLVLPDGQFTPVSSLKLLFDEIANTRTVYTLGYTSQDASMDNPRTVDLTVTLPDDRSVTTPFTYELRLQPPEVRFANNNQFAPVRVPDRVEGGTDLTYDELEQTVTIAVDFPDGIPRELSVVRLEVIETVTGQIQQSTLQPLVPDENGQIDLTWSLDEFAAPDRITQVNVTVLVEDSLSTRAEISRPGQVTVLAAPPLPTATPLPTPLPEDVVEGEGLAGIAAVGNGEAGVGDATGGVGGVGLRTISILIVIIAILVVLVALVISRILQVYRLANEDRLIVERVEPEPVEEVDMAQAMVPEDEAELVLVEEEPEVDPMEGVLMRIVVREGYDQLDGLESRLVLVRDEDYIAGRSEDADWVITSPYVSPMHCRFIVEDDEYFVRDMNSKNGTYINGERVNPGLQVPIPVGSEVWITRKIVVQVFDMKSNLEDEDFSVGASDAQAMSAEDLVYEPLPGIQPVFEDEAGTDDEYNPL
ncbi:MAG: FHA domain-containing protein [Chloroflexota bacterium]